MAMLKTRPCPGCGLSAKITLPWEEARALMMRQLHPHQAAPSLSENDLRQAAIGWCPRCYQREAERRNLAAGCTQRIQSRLAPSFV